MVSNKQQPHPLLRFKLPPFFHRHTRKPPPKPLLDLDDVRAFIQSLLHNPKITHQTYPPLPPSASVSDMGTIGPSLSRSSADGSRPAEGQDGHVPSFTMQDCQLPFSRSPNFPASSNSQLAPQEEQGRPPLLDIDDVRDAMDKFAQFCSTIQRCGMPETSWHNKMPWHVPRAPFLARGLQWPPESFDSEEERREFYRKARKRKPYLMGAPPLWSVTAFNLGVLCFLMFNPLSRFFLSL